MFVINHTNNVNCHLSR